MESRQNWQSHTADRRVNQDSVPKGIHHGITGATAIMNTYRLQIDCYETGAVFRIRDAFDGGEGNQ